MDNSLFVRELQFGAGDGYLHYYLYNWKGEYIVLTVLSVFRPVSSFA